MTKKELNEIVKGYALMVLKDYIDTDKEIGEAMAELDGILGEVTAEEARSYYMSQI